MPVNIRFELYKKKEDIKTENCFAAMPCKLPLCSTMKDSY
jgi:hypothetical protein